MQVDAFKEKAASLLPFLSKHWSKLLLSALTIACVVAWGERFLKKSQSQSQSDFLVANKIFEQFQRGEPLQKESIESTENLLLRHPELHAKFDPLLALTFYSHHDPVKGAHYARSLIEGSDPLLPPLYKEYAETSLLIEEGKYAPAFQAALALQEKLSDLEKYPSLRTMNRLRLLLLADQLGDQAQKSIYWKELERDPAYPTIQSLFQEGCLTLKDYIES
jgi:hypothetical protein